MNKQDFYQNIESINHNDPNETDHENHRQSLEECYHNIVRSLILFVCSYLEEKIKLKLVERRVRSKYPHGVVIDLVFDNFLVYKDQANKHSIANLFKDSIVDSITPLFRVNLWMKEGKGVFDINIQNYLFKNKKLNPGVHTVANSGFTTSVLLNKREYTDRVERLKSLINKYLSEDFALVYKAQGGSR